MMSDFREKMVLFFRGWKFVFWVLGFFVHTKVLLFVNVIRWHKVTIDTGKYVQFFFCHFYY